MQSRRDQVQAQSYVLGRLTAALVSADPDGLEGPHRRTTSGTIYGTILAALIVAGFAVFGYIVPGGSSKWQQPGVLVVEKETGTRYVYVDGLLRPVLNYASARLLFAKNPKTVLVSQRSLAAVPHGQPIGIVGAPDALPAGGAVEDQVWTVCALATKDQAGTLFTSTVLKIEKVDAQSRRDRPLSPDQAIVVAAGGQRFLVWHGVRLRLGAPWLARILGYDHDAFPVEAGWLESVPVGPDLTAVAVPSRGIDGPIVDGRRAKVGELFVARTVGGADRHYLLQADGLAELTPVEYAIASADPGTAQVYAGRPVQPTELSNSALIGLPVSRAQGLPSTLPRTPPELLPLQAGGTWCVRQAVADGSVEVTAEPSSTAAVHATPEGAGVNRTSRTAAAVTVQAGVGGLVVAGRAGQVGGPPYYLVTDSGVKYPMAGADVANRLGYPAAGATPVPRQLLDMLPTGPLLEFG
ncbi:type VII secretion protein EccB [Dactylosporangium darangshiense]|uniref:Type VII secretion protein EccB n=1 Tax=Dactylosporangium darangshiense TaxID=579108 RepID=A0ABP8DWC4_9ACTN